VRPGKQERISQSRKGAAVAALITGSIGVIAAAYVTNMASLEDAPWLSASMWIIVFAIVTIAVVVAVLTFLQANEDLVIDEQGIRIERELNVKKELLWSNFGGFESVTPKVNRGF